MFPSVLAHHAVMEAHRFWAKPSSDYSSFYLLVILKHFLTVLAEKH